MCESKQPAALKTPLNCHQTIHGSSVVIKQLRTTLGFDPMTSLNLQGVHQVHISGHTPSFLMKKSNLGRQEFTDEAYCTDFQRQESVAVRVTKQDTDMEGAIKTVVMQFLSQAKGKESLNGKSFQKLVQGQLGNIMSDTESSSAVKDMMKGLDDNKDGKVSFQEYMTLIGYLANSISEQRAQPNAAGGQ